MVDNVTEEPSFNALTAQGHSIQEKFLSFFPEMPTPLLQMTMGASSITPAFDIFRKNKAASPKLEEQNAQAKTPSKPQA